MKKTRNKLKARILKTTGQPIDPKTGRFQAKPGKVTRPIAAGQSVMEILATRADAQRIARVLEKQAYGGNPAAIELMVRAVELQRQATSPSTPNLEKLPYAELAVLGDIVQHLEGKELPTNRRLRNALLYVAELHNFHGRAVEDVVQSLLYNLEHPEPPAEEVKPVPAKDEPAVAAVEVNAAPAPTDGRVVSIEDIRRDTHTGVDLDVNAGLRRPSPWLVG